jgi:CRP-like cAMP-binding protein
VTIKERPATVEDLRPRKLFRDVPQRVIKKLMQEGEVKVLSLQSRLNLKLRRDSVEYLYIIISGHLEVRLDSQLIKKGKNFLLAFRGPDQVVGEMRAITKERGEAVIKTCESCELIEIPSDALILVAETDWRIYRNIAAILVEKTFQERKRIEVIQMPEGEAQVAQALLNFLDERGIEAGTVKEKRIRGILRQSDIADYIGCDRTTVAKRLSSLKKRKVIDYPDSGRNNSQKITICNLPLLQRAAKQRKGV